LIIGKKFVLILTLKGQLVYNFYYYEVIGMLLLVDDLKGTPRPHYLVEAEVSEDGMQLSGKVVFPSSDPTISDRIDHVNVAHHLFALWNAAHLMARQRGVRHPLVKQVEVKLLRVTRPDVLVNLSVKITDLQDKGKSLFGRLDASFSDESGTLAEIKAEFSVLK
jgi:hypothetical protein